MGGNKTKKCKFSYSKQNMTLFIPDNTEFYWICLLLMDCMKMMETYIEFFVLLLMLCAPSLSAQDSLTLGNIISDYLLL